MFSCEVSYSPVTFGAYQGDGTSNIGPSVALGNLTENANASNGVYETVTIPANTFVSESFSVAPSTFFNTIVIPVAYPFTIGASTDITMAVYVNGQMIVQGNNDIAMGSNPPQKGTPTTVPEYDSDYFFLTQNYQVAAGSIVTIGFVADGPLGIFPFQNVLGNGSSIANISSIPSSLSELPNNSSALPVFLAFGMAS